MNCTATRQDHDTLAADTSLKTQQIFVLEFLPFHISKLRSEMFIYAADSDDSRSLLYSLNTL